MGGSGEEKKGKGKGKEKESLLLLLEETGSKLCNLPLPLPPKDSLLKLFKVAARCLSSLDESSSSASLEDCVTAIAKPEILKHQDKDVNLAVATCFCQIARITAPAPPYAPDTLRHFLGLLVATLTGLPAADSFGIFLLDTLARYWRLIIHSQDLLNHMFATFFSVSNHQPHLLDSMRTLILLVLPHTHTDTTFLPILSNNLQSPLASTLIQHLVPFLTPQLSSHHVHTRLQALQSLFALPHPISHPILSLCLQRLTDRAVQVRLTVVHHISLSLLSNPSSPQAPLIIASLTHRLLDYDENVRKLVVAALCDLACLALKSISVETLKLVADRLRDKTFLVKRYTMERIAEVYKIYCLKYSDGSINTHDFEWIPGKILRCLYDRDFRSETIEFVLCGSLFPMDSTTKDRVMHWVTAYNGFDKVEVKALEKVLEQKQRLQLEMKKYLSCRQMHQEGEASELQKKILVAFRVMSRWFIDPSKAEENFQILDQLKDAHVWKILINLSDPDTSFLQTWKLRDDLLRILGERHPLYDFLDTLSLKCSYVPFDKESVKELFLTITKHRSGGTQYVRSCMNLLAMLARFSPTLLSGTECDLVSYLKEDDDTLKEGALHILARAGGTIREHLAVVSSPVDLILERLCVEGSRKQAKYAVHALAAITKDDGLKSLSVLYKRLVDMLADGNHLPAVLQSLGCIAQIAMPIFETREGEIIDFIKSNLLKCSTKAEDRSKINWDERSEVCLLKIYGMKTLVKSYLPAKDAHLRVGVEDLLTMIKSTLSIGEIFSYIESSPVDKAHMKLASAKAILRLSKQWDHMIPIEVFHLTLRTSENCYSEARQQFLGKVYQYLKDKLLDVKFACAFVHGIDMALPLEFKEYKRNLAEVMQMCVQAKARQHPMQCDANPLMIYPEYLLPYLVHSVAYHPSFPDIDECTDVGPFETIYRRLHLFLSLLMLGDEDGHSEIINCKDKESISAIISIFHSINHSEDTMDMTKSKNSHAVCEIGLSITKYISRNQEHLIGLATSVPLPSTLYKPLEKKNAAISVGEAWVGRDVVLAHLESLKLEADGAVVNTDENNVPLGQIIKGFRSKKSPTENLVNDLDILGMVREINNNVEIKSESSNESNVIDKMSDSDFVLTKRRKLKRKRKEKQSLVGCRIKVWWPLDNKFYQGLVQSYDPKMGKHQIVYEDGDLEFLRLDKEHWLPLDDDHQMHKKDELNDQEPLAKWKHRRV